MAPQVNDLLARIEVVHHHHAIHVRRGEVLPAVAELDLSTNLVNQCVRRVTRSIRRSDPATDMDISFGDLIQRGLKKITLMGSSR